MTQTADTSPAVSFTGVVKSFGTVRAVDGAGLDIPRGETVALLGRNGAGKSTAIGLLLGLDEPDAGAVRLFGRPPARAVAAGRVGAMLQDGRPIRRVTVRELVTFVASTFPRPLPVAEALALAGLTELAGRRVDKLSGGQIQRVRFAVALAGGPELIVLDEPTAALDVEARRAFWASMRAYADRGNTVLFSTHYLEEADSYADRIVVIDHGRIVADGTSELIKRSAGGHLVAFDLPDGASGDDTEWLGLLPGVVSAEIRGARARLRSDDSDATVVALAGLGAIRRLEVSPATLEDAFLTLTRKTAERLHEAATENAGENVPENATESVPEKETA
ncbi:ABC transporter ATP-binding protein [Streptomyces sp. AK02-01A]|uniref:ABC transporter ATP-binding protein n=1 Tax=Streptomyces sp. AK02-01A TaxID=3028648 RepID=UPI0029A09AFF|nr:ABC transporter ATP-binding protein [Streptomyces sp. AK02-01A]MDX3849604.1 ABC transporter ATP-binding protein [Streptomyces sp. AK02-01A]MDX3849826.1 ABC transporter ATP-binding protein [Streptomyces sp. AK02-01A]